MVSLNVLRGLSGGPPNTKRLHQGRQVFFYNAQWRLIPLSGASAAASMICEQPQASHFPAEKICTNCMATAARRGSVARFLCAQD